MIKICISVTSHALYPPPPVTNCHTFSDPLERDVLYGRPLNDPQLNESEVLHQQGILEQALKYSQPERKIDFKVKMRREDSK